MHIHVRAPTWICRFLPRRSWWMDTGLKTDVAFSRSLYEIRVPVFSLGSSCNRGRWVSSVYRSSHEPQDPRCFDRETVIAKMYHRSRSIAFQNPTSGRSSSTTHPLVDSVLAKRAKCRRWWGNSDGPTAAGSGKSTEKLAKAAIVRPHQVPPCLFSSCCFFYLYFSGFVECVIRSIISTFSFFFLSFRTRRSKYSYPCLI